MWKTYNVNGSRESLTYANGNVTTYGYNLANWLTSLENKDGSEVISSFTYGYYASGNQRTETDHEGVTTTYTYDGLGRLTQEASSEGKVYNYTYDANSNRASMVVTNNGITIESVNYTYDANNRLLTEATTLLAGSETTTYTYDDNGNLLSNHVYSSTNTVIGSLVYTYDGFNQQASVSANSGTVTAHYTYNAQGIRDSKTLGITTTEFLLDGGAVIGEQTGSSIDTYLRGSNLISSNGEEYYLFNGHGDVVNLSNANGSSTKTYEYDAFGVEQNIDTLDHNPFRYCGEFYDEETGTYYLRARYYDPKRGRFLNADGYASTGQGILGYNMFAYCGNNPVIRVDDGGELWNIIAGVVIGAVVNVAISAITNKMAGNDYTLQDAVSDAITGGITGGMAASGLGVVAQAVGNALVGMADTAIDIYRENGTITLNDADDLAISAGLGFMFGYYGGNGLANSSRAMKQIIIIDANMHCLARASAKNTVVSCIKHISDGIIENGVKFISSSVFANSIAAVQQK